MYNGVGIVTPRGSGTSGHVQKNAALPRRRVDHRDARRKEEERKNVSIPRDKVAPLLDHERKRAIELKVQKWVRDSDLKAKHSREEVAKLIQQKRKELSGGRRDNEDDGERREKKKRKEAKPDEKEDK